MVRKPSRLRSSVSTTMRKKRPATVPVGSAFTSLPLVKGNRGIDLQVFVDEMVEHGDRQRAYLAAGGDEEMNPSTMRATCHQLLAMPEIKQAVVERAAQKYFDLAPVATSVLKDVLSDTSTDPKMVKLRADVALKITERIHIESHAVSDKQSRARATEAVEDLTGVMAQFHEFVSKNPEWSGVSRRSAVVIDGDAELPAVEEQEPT